MSDRLDQNLRNVPLPPGMLDRLRKSGYSDATDDELDAALRDVAAPQDFAVNLRTAVWEQVELDQQLRAVEVSDAFMVRLRTIAHKKRDRVTPWVRRVSAAAALLMLAAAYGLAMWEVAGSLQQEPIETAATEYIYEGPLQFDSADIREVAVFDSEPILPSEEPPEQNNADAVAGSEFTPDQPSFFIKTAYQPHSDLLSELVDGFRPEVDWVALRSGVFGSADSTDDELPQFAPAPLPVSAGVEPPFARGFDRSFLLRHGVHPIVQLQGDSELERSSVSLTAATPHFDRMRETLAADRVPTSRNARVDEFITAIEPPHADAEPGAIAIRTAGGPSPFHQGESQLLLLAAQAGKALRKSPATHLTIAIDISSSMLWNTRLDATLKAVRRLARSLDRQDRLSIVVFNEQAESVIEFATHRDVESIDRALQQIRPSGGTNLSRGIQQGVSAAMNPEASDLRKLMVLVTDDRGPQDGLSTEMVDMLAAVSEFDLQVALLYCGDDKEALHGLELLGVNVQRLPAPMEIGDALIDSFVGDSSALIGEECEMSIEWNRQQVSAWRLLGREPSGGGLLAAEQPARLSALQAAHVAYEVWLRPNAEGEIASATLSWRDPKSGRRETVSQPIFATQFSPSFAESPRAVQAASLAAEAAEILRQSPFSTSPRGDLRSVLKRCQFVSSRLADSPAFDRFVIFLEALHLANEQNPIAKGSN